MPAIGRVWPEHVRTQARAIPHRNSRRFFRSSLRRAFAHDAGVRALRGARRNRLDGGDVLVRANEHEGAGLATCTLLEGAAGIEQRPLAEPGIEWRVLTRYEIMLQCRRGVFRNL